MCKFGFLQRIRLTSIEVNFKGYIIRVRRLCIFKQNKDSLLRNPSTSRIKADFMGDNKGRCAGKITH